MTRLVARWKRCGAQSPRAGLPLTLAEQDRSRWDRSAIARAGAALAAASANPRGLGYCGLQAAAEGAVFRRRADALHG